MIEVLEQALLPGGVRDRVLVEHRDGRFVKVEPDSTEAVTLRGLTIPGLANCHSHAFHRALRGHTQAERGSFWTWREQMYAVAGRLDPDSYLALARAAYAEMASVGITAVGEFHYLHHGPGGTAYADPHAMSHALVTAAAEAGIRITLLDACYLSAGFGEPPAGVQVRYSDGDAEAWARRAGSFVPVGDHARAGAAIHSVRAVPRDQLGTVVEAARGLPLHAHLSEQTAENDACLAATGLTPTGLLAEADALGPLTSVVHATHLADADLALLGSTRTTACLCPTTERDLADGIGPGRRLLDAGSPLTLGSDSHAVVDLFEEMRALETHERLATHARGHFTATELVDAGLGHASLGWDDAGAIEVGRRADLVTLDLASPTTAGSGARAETVAFAATGADVRRTVVDGRVVFDGDRGRVGADLATAIERVLA